MSAQPTGRRFSPAPPRRLAGVWAGKLTRRSTRLLGSGGTALPGLVAERFDRNLVRSLAAELDAAVLVTGTNGKTTTSAMLSRILTRDGRRVLHNRAGSNLMRGVLTSLIDASGARGRLPAGLVGVFETDEAAFDDVAAAVRPTAVLFTNLMRDQLDRYGEIDAIAGRWGRALAQLDPEARVVLNVDDPLISTLERSARGPVLRFGIEDTEVGTATEAELADALWDPVSGDDFRYDHRFYAHLGHWRTAGGARRPAPSVSAADVASADGEMRFALRLGDAEPLAVELPAEGLYSVYNALAAASAAAALGVGGATIAAALGEHRAAFGRQEALRVDGRRVRILLGKNPAGMNQALRTLQTDGAKHHLLVALNDGIADGTDVSWIWDTDWEAQAAHCASLTLAGDRIAELALRLEYAGFPAPREPLQAAIGVALEQALAALPQDAELVILPTYTALIEVRGILGRMPGATELWESA